jgi:predicted transcriptional regulator
MKISEIMTDDVITLSPDDTMAKALNIMYEKRINQIPSKHLEDNMLDASALKTIGQLL